MKLFGRLIRSVALSSSLLSTTALSTSAQEILRLQMNGDIMTLDPISTTHLTIRNASYLLYDTLFAMDAKNQIRPQMAEGYSVSDDGLTYTIALRDGLKFHDGSPVNAEDAVASIKRWAQVDGMGKLMFAKLSDISATDPKTLVIKMKEPWAQVIPALGKISSNVPVIMPARLAATPASESVKEFIGSGPYSFVREEWVPGALTVFKKFEDYVPRKEEPSVAAGGKVAHFDRVEIHYIPDAATAVDALIAGEIDWMEEVPPDLLDLLEGQDSVRTIVNPGLSKSTQLVLNHKNPPFDNEKIRQALQWALDQPPFLHAAYGDKSDYYKECAAVFFCNGPYASDVNTERVLIRDIGKAKALLKEAGYDGTPVLLQQVTDIAIQERYYSVLIPMMREAGFVVKVEPTDWATVAARRTSKAPVSDGGWNMFFTGWSYVDQSNPMTNVYVSGACDNGWFGWACSEELQKLRDEFAITTDPARQKELTARMQEVTHDLVPYIPLGEFFNVQGASTKLDGWIDSPVPFFWGVRRSDNCKRSILRTFIGCISWCKGCPPIERVSTDGNYGSGRRQAACAVCGPARKPSL